MVTDVLSRGTEEFNMDFLEKIRAEREDHDETIREIALALGIKHSQYSRYENGRNEMPIRYLVEFCHHYSISADYLLGIPYNYRKPR